MATISSSLRSLPFPSSETRRNTSSVTTSAARVGSHAPKFGVDFIHEPVLSGAFPGTPETLYVLTENPTYYLTNPSPTDRRTRTAFRPSTAETARQPRPAASNGSFSQNIQRLGLYAMDTWRVTPELTINYGLRWDTTFGLFQASGVSQALQPGSTNHPRTRSAPAHRRPA